MTLSTGALVVFALITVSVTLFVSERLPPDMTAIAVLVITIAPTVWILFTATALLGLCTGLYGPARFPLLSAVFPERDGTALGISQATGNLGNVLLPAIAGVLASTVAWQLGFGVVLPLFIIVAVTLWYVVPRHPEGRRSAIDTLSIDSARYLFAELTDRSVVVVVVIQVLGSTMYQGFTDYSLFVCFLAIATICALSG